MSIAPVDTFPPATRAPLGNSSAGVGRGHAQPETPSAPVWGTRPKQESSSAKNVPATLQLPPDVVEVHQDPDIKGQIITQYLDQSRNLVLQVPSAEELSVERGIAQEFQQVAQPRPAARTAAAGREGGKAYGN